MSQLCLECNEEIHPEEVYEYNKDLINAVDSGKDDLSHLETALYLGQYCIVCCKKLSPTIASAIIFCTSLYNILLYDTIPETSAVIACMCI